jgi:cytochrome c oxidase subunit 3
MPEISVAPQEHFTSMEQQRESAHIGMWLFLMTELMLFSGLFTAFAFYRQAYPAGFEIASHHAELTLGAVNTAVLLISSLTMALAVRAAKLGQSRAIAAFLAATFFLGIAFLALKGTEYMHHFQDHLFPGPGFSFEGPNANAVEIFFYLYFTMTGLHALHMLLGLMVVVFMIVRALRGHFTAGYPTPVELAGLYWHFVDVVWIFLFPMFYLLGKR